MSEKLFVVDRREGKVVVVVDDAGEATDVSAALLPRDCRAEGVVLRIPVSANGAPDWSSARRDREEERRRVADAARRIKKLGRSDAGGDVEL